jgi:pimeloyl-ACP methyl ester carboxylesterase
MRIVTSILLMSACMALSAHAAEAPCTQAAAACTTMLALPGSQGRVLVYRSYPLDARNGQIKRALIVVHGLTRDGPGYYRSALAGAFLAGALEDTVVVVPQFSSNEDSCKDSLAPGELSWHCQPRTDTWRHGGDATDGSVNSFNVVDELLRKLNDKEVFPNMRAIVVFGHSAGGQYVNRYQMANTVHESLRVKPTYLVANPSSYAYFDELRPRAAAFVAGEVVALAPGWQEPLPEKPRPAFAPYGDRRNCTTYDSWPYGMHNRNGYTAKVSEEQMKKNLVARPATYLLAEFDLFPVYGFDGSCAAMAQGPTRVARGVAYAKYVALFGAKHPVVSVDGCAHSTRCMLTSEQTLPLLFPNQ